MANVVDVSEMSEGGGEVGGWSIEGGKLDNRSFGLRDIDLAPERRGPSAK